MHRIVALTAATALAAGVTVTLGATAAAAAGTAAVSVPGGYVPVKPARVIDTATGAYGNHKGPIGAHKSISVLVDGSDHVPSGAAAVVVSLAVTGASKSGVIAVSAPSATSVPRAAAVSFPAGGGSGDLAVVPVADGRIRVWNNSTGSVQLTADVSGYYAAGSGTAGGAFRVHATSAARVVDTRYGTDGNHKGVVRSGATIGPRISGLGGVPADASGVAATVTVMGATASGTVSVRTSGGSSVPASLQVQSGRQSSQLLVLPLSAGSGGLIAITNGTGKPVNFAVDVSGYYVAGAAATASVTQAVEATTVAKQSIPANASGRIAVAGHGGVPRSGAVAAVVTLRVVKAGARGTLSAASGSVPTVVQFSAGSTRSGVIIAPLDSSGSITVANRSSRKNNIQVDVDGYVPGTAVTVPAASRSHYLRVTSASQLMAAGAADAADGSRFVVLDLGAQTNKGDGVVLSATDDVVPYAKVPGLIDDYAGAYAAQSSSPVTIAIATNNSGDFSALSATKRGQLWAELLQQVRAKEQAHAQVTLVAADDIESGFEFASSESQAQKWEDAFVGALPRTSSAPTDLYYIGSADGCPTTFGAAGRTCSAGWTEAQYLSLAGGTGPDAGRIQALPQVYLNQQAVQWANIAATASGGVATIDGSLTEHAACPSASSSGCGGVASLSASDGFVDLFRSLSSVGTPHLSYATDLDIID